VRTKDILITFIVIVIIVAGILVIRNRVKVTPKATPSAVPSIQQQVESKFNGLVIPQGEASIELKDVSGGVGMGIATRSEVIADLPILPNGQFYQVSLENNGKAVLLGKLSQAKGGWILNFNSSNYPGYNKVIVAVGAKHILEGSF
jgi:hypothetical protein